MTDGPIIRQAGKLGRIRPGTRLAVREATDVEIELRRARLAELAWDGDPEPEPERWFVVFADEPSKVLHDWFVPVGGRTREEALTQAARYADARGAVVVAMEDRGTERGG